MNGTLAIISGTGDLPRLLAEHCQRVGQEYCVAVLKGTEVDWLDGHPIIAARAEKVGKLFKDLNGKNCKSVVFAGAIARPSVNPLKLDKMGMKLASEVLGSAQKGDDATLRIIITLFEGQGFNVIAPHEILPDLMPGIGILTLNKPAEIDQIDAARAAEIVDRLGELDVGQGAVISKGLCLAMESIQGTDIMLKFVEDTRRGKGGVLLKAPKPTQDIRIDMPTIGVQTIRNAHAACLSGVVIAAKGVMIINRQETIDEANKLGLFLWVRE